MYASTIMFLGRCSQDSSKQAVDSFDTLYQGPYYLAHQFPIEVSITNYKLPGSLRIRAFNMLYTLIYNLQPGLLRLKHTRLKQVF